MISVDYRIGSKELAAPLHQLGAQVAVKLLPFGDVCFRGGSGGLRFIGIERKTVGDLLACICDNRFSGHQLPGLLDRYDIVYLLVEGPWRPDKRTGLLQSGHVWEFNTPGRSSLKTGIAWHEHRRPARMMYAGFDGFQCSVEQLARIHVVRTLDLMETVWWIWSRYCWYQKGKHTSLQPMLKRLHERPRDVEKDDAPRPLRYGKATWHCKAIAQYPGLNWVKAHALEAAFPTHEALMQASVKDLLTVEGIGPTLAAGLYKELHWK